MQLYSSLNSKIRNPGNGEVNHVNINEDFYEISVLKIGLKISSYFKRFKHF
jgi:hypothetical protein